MIQKIKFNSWNYKWICSTDGKCVRQHTDKDITTNPTFESQNVCRLVCGKYGALWPQPTGRTTLGNELIQISPDQIRSYFFLTFYIFCKPNNQHYN